ncbi:MAG: caspase family protein, partial [Cyanobacteriota bacterium]
MANHACVAIGINRYQFLPPLNYGQADAQAFWQFLVNQADLPSNQCLLLTETSPLVGNQPTYPTRDNIWRWVEAQGQTAWHSGNWRWFFFSGYGVSWEQVDYLLPIDANPKDIPGTGIPVRSLLTSLKAQSGENLLVFLDINRSPGLQAGAPVGSEIVELARQMGIVLVLSSQLHQFSHEAAALGNGLFTAALLEALRYYHTDLTLDKLEQYLRDRLPELSQHHWRPIQTPLIVTPAGINKQQLILPTAIDSRAFQQNMVGSSMAFTSNATRWDTDYTYENNSYNGTNGTAAPRPNSSVSAVETRTNNSVTPITPSASNQTASMPSAIVLNKPSESATNKTPWWKPLLLWGGSAALALALMIAAVVLRNRNAFTSNQTLETPVLEIPPTTSSLNPAPTSRSPLPVGSPQTSLQSRLQANQAALDRAKRLLRPNQASLFSKAIIEARSVKPGDPLYLQAQQDIQRWSSVILDLAEGRANEGNFGGAIAAAQLVPQDQPSVYADAQRMINQWKILTIQQQQN